MTETRTAQYEGMFLFPQSAVADLQGTVETVKQMLTARGATICSITKWDERRLAYDIAGNKRGLYILAYFTAPTAMLKEIERDCNLNERMLAGRTAGAAAEPSRSAAGRGRAAGSAARWGCPRATSTSCAAACRGARTARPRRG